MGRKKILRSNMSGIANRLQQLIGDGNISDFERKCGLSKSTVQRIYEGAEPTRPTLEAILKETACDPLWLLTGEVCIDKNAPNAEAPGADDASPHQDVLAVIFLGTLGELHRLYRGVQAGIFPGEAYRRILLVTDEAIAKELQQNEERQKSSRGQTEAS